MLSSKKASLLRRSKSSLQSLTSSGSEWSSAGSMTPPPQTSRLGLQHSSSITKRSSSSSLFLQGNSDSSLNNQVVDDLVHTDNNASFNRMLAASSVPTAASAATPSLLADPDSITLVQCLLLVTMALQIPNYIDEIVEILELHIHSFPLLIVLGVFPSLYLKKKQHAVNPTSQMPMPTTSTMHTSSNKNLITPQSSLADIEEYYRNHTDSPIKLQKCSPVQSTGTDEWGHFAELEETFCEQDVGFIIPSTTLSRRASLSTLVEEAEEEE